MPAITPAIGFGMVVKVNGAVVKAASFRRQREAGQLPLPTSGLSANADSQYEIPETTGGIRTRYVLSAPFDTANPFHSNTYNIRPGKVVSVRLGMTSTLLTPDTNFNVLSTTDENEAEQLGRWEAVFTPNTDTTPGYFTEAS